MKRFLLLAPAYLLMAVSFAQGDSITYDLTAYTAVDNLNSANTDTVTGTLTLSNSAGSPLGTYNSTDALGGVTIFATLTMISSDSGIAPVTVTGGGSIGDDTPPSYNWLETGSLTATAAGLFLSHDGTLMLDYASNAPFPPYIIGQLDPHDNNGIVSLSANSGGNNGAATMQIFVGNQNALYGEGSWQIAVATPEPSTLLLGAIGVVGLLVFRRRQA
jgi:hypothetical protein